MNEQELAVAFGLNLRLKRKKSGMTQQELAQNVGVTRVYIGLIERGETSITLEKVYRLADALECHLLDLLPSNGDKS